MQEMLYGWRDVVRSVCTSSELYNVRLGYLLRKPTALGRVRQIGRGLEIFGEGEGKVM